MNSIEVKFQSSQTTIDIQSLLHCLERCCKISSLGFHPIEMYDTGCISILITFPKPLCNHAVINRFDAALIGWCWGRGMPNCHIEYPME